MKQFKSNKIVKWIWKEIITSNIVVSNILFLSGVVIFYSFISNDKIGGKYYLAILALSYFVLGLGLYGILKWIVKNALQLIYFVVYLILRGNIEVRIAQNKISYKLHYK